MEPGNLIKSSRDHAMISSLILFRYQQTILFFLFLSLAQGKVIKTMGVQPRQQHQLKLEVEFEHYDRVTIAFDAIPTNVARFCTHRRGAESGRFNSNFDSLRSLAQ